MVAISPVRRLGRAFRGRTAGLAASANLPVFLGRVLYHLVFDIIIRRKYGRTLAKQVSDITVGVGALVIGGGMIFVIATMSLATGAMVGLQGYPGLERIGAEAFTGLVASYSNVREVTPIIAGVALVAQVGTGFTAEIGAMRISEEVDALEVMGINSLAYLVCTRVAGSSRSSTSGSRPASTTTTSTSTCRRSTCSTASSRSRCSRSSSCSSTATAATTRRAARWASGSRPGGRSASRPSS